LSVLADLYYACPQAWFPLEERIDEEKESCRHDCAQLLHAWNRLYLSREPHIYRTGIAFFACTVLSAALSSEAGLSAGSIAADIGGALQDRLESSAAIQGSVDSLGVGKLIDFDPYDHGQIPEKAGVYVFYDISQRPIYVGQAINIASRIREHNEKFWFKRPIVELGAYIEIKDKTLRNQVETVLIQFLKNNAVINKNKTARD